jgi:histidinol dehydrogenase
MTDIAKSVAEIIADVRARGDQAVLDYTERWDGVRLGPGDLRVPAEKLEAEVEESNFAAAFSRAVERIEKFHNTVKPRTSLYEDEDGVLMGMRWTPISSVGLYVPGGKAAYPSTLAMTALPARIAGVERIVVVSPPGPDGEISPQVMMAARILGIEEIYRAGGAQAIAALAIGTESIPRVDKIFGPGNAFVAEAKLQLFGEVGIDMFAGPSELVVYADETADPRWAAADLLAQAEHDESTRVTLLASGEGVLKAVRQGVAELLEQSPRRKTIEISLERNGIFEVISDPGRAAARINEIAPEHLALQVANPFSFLPLVKNAGAIFLGKESPVAVGDYFAGPNHVLPTGGTARFASCLSVEDFMKRSNLVRMNLDFVRDSGPAVEELALGEGLPAHADSVAIRCQEPGQARVRGGLQGVTPYLLVEEEGKTKLNQNESPWDIPTELKDEISSRLRDLPWNRYHQGIPQAFLDRIAADADLPAGSVLAASGSNLILQWIFEAYAGPGRSILVPSPSFSLYPLWAQVTESRLETVQLSDDLSYDAEAVLAALSNGRPDVTVLCLPNNPTGSELATEDVRKIAAAVGECGGLLVIDEAYREFSAESFDRTALVREFDNLVLVRTCSKAFSAAGMRLGYLLAPVALATELSKLVPPFHLGLFTAVLGDVLWENKALFDERAAMLNAERKRMQAAAAELEGVKVFASEANFFLFEVADAGKVHEELKKRGILIRRQGGSERLENCLRVSAGTTEENDSFLDSLREIQG